MIYPQIATGRRGRSSFGVGRPKIDWSNPLTQGLTGVWLCNVATQAGTAAAVLENLVTGHLAPLISSSPGFYGADAVSRIGKGRLLNDTNYNWQLDTAARLYGSSLTFGVVRRFINTTMQPHSVVGDGGALNCFFPYSDSNIYWDFPSQAAGRISFAYTPTTNLEVWALTGGAGGRWVWKDGAQQYNDTTTTAGGSPSGNLTVNAGNGNGGYANQEYYLFATWNRQLRPAECMAWTLDPLQFLVWGDDRLASMLVGTAVAAGPSPFFGLALPEPRGYSFPSILRTHHDPLKLLAGRDTFFAGPGQPAANLDQPNPVRRRDDVNQRGWFVNLLLSTLYTVIVPFGVSDWPNPWGRLFPASLRTHADPVKLELAGQDQFFGLPGQPAANQDQPNPTQRVSTPVNRTWFGNLLQTTLGFIIAPFAMLDHPNPRGYVFPTSLRTHTDQLRILAGKDQFFTTPGRGPAYDWPNPRGYVPGISLRTHTDPLKLELRGQDRMFGAAGEPPKPSDFPVPKGYAYPSGLRTFIATLSAAASAFRAPSTRLLNPVPSLVPADTLNVANWLVRASRAINGMLRGNIGATLHITLAAGATSSVIYDARINANSHIGLSPQTASAATALTGLYIVPANGQATIFHANTADLDKKFAAVVLR